MCMRKKGYTYSEISQSLHVSKSTLSGWLSEVELDVAAQNRIDEIKKQSRLKGASIRKKERIEKTRVLKTKAEKNIAKLIRNERFIAGLALYWAEGSKEKVHRPDAQIDFANTDIEMIKIMIKWLHEFCSCAYNDISIKLYIHDSEKQKIQHHKEYWENGLDFARLRIDYVYYKKHTVKKDYSNRIDYHGTLRVIAKRSVDKNRIISGWISGLAKKY